MLLQWWLPRYQLSHECAWIWWNVLVICREFGIPSPQNMSGISGLRFLVDVRLKGTWFAVLNVMSMASFRLPNDSYANTQNDTATLCKR